MLKNSKNFLAIILGTVFMGLFLPLEAHAVLGFVANLAIAIVAAIVTAAVQIVIHITGLSIMLSAWFMRVSMNIPIVDSWARDVGWTLTRDFVNMLFIIILAWIGIATILRLKEYQTGKILIRLLIIALLINFSPVLVGLVVDFSNIIAYYFISGIVERPAPVREGEAEGLASMEGLVATHPDDPEKMGIIASAREAVLAVHARIWGNLRRPVLETTSDLFMIITYGLLFFITTIVFFILAVVFLLRVIAFWILLILAPFAFIAYILPQTNKFFWQWWQQLVQWAFIGITASASVYLSFAFLERAMEREGEEGVGFEGIGQELVHFEERVAPGFLVEGMSRFFETFLPFIVMLIIMGAGLLLGFVTSAAGASTAINFAQTKGSQYTKGVGKYVGEKAKGTEIGQRAGKRIMATRERLEKSWVPDVLTGKPGAARARQRAAIDEESKKLRGLRKEDLEARAKRKNMPIEEQMALFEKMAEEKADIKEGFAEKAISYGADPRAYYKQRPDKVGIDEEINKFLERMTPREIRINLQPKALENDTVLAYVVKDKAVTDNIILHGSLEQKQKIADRVYRLKPKDFQRFGFKDETEFGKFLKEQIDEFTKDIRMPSPSSL